MLRNPADHLAEASAHRARSEWVLPGGGGEGSPDPGRVATGRRVTAVLARPGVRGQEQITTRDGLERGDGQAPARAKRSVAEIVAGPRIMPSWFHPMPNCSRSTVNDVSSVSPAALASVSRAVRDCDLLMPRTVS